MISKCTRSNNTKSEHLCGPVKPLSTRHSVVREIQPLCKDRLSPNFIEEDRNSLVRPPTKASLLINAIRQRAGSIRLVKATEGTDKENHKNGLNQLLRKLETSTQNTKYELQRPEKLPIPRISCFETQRPSIPLAKRFQTKRLRSQRNSTELSVTNKSIKARNLSVRPKLFSVRERPADNRKSHFGQVDANRLVPQVGNIIDNKLEDIRQKVATLNRPQSAVLVLSKRAVPLQDHLSPDSGNPPVKLPLKLRNLLKGYATDRKQTENQASAQIEAKIGSLGCKVERIPQTECAENIPKGNRFVIRASGRSDLCHQKVNQTKAKAQTTERSVTINDSQDLNSQLSQQPLKKKFLIARSNKLPSAFRGQSCHKKPQPIICEVQFEDNSPKILQIPSSTSIDPQNVFCAGMSYISQIRPVSDKQFFLDPAEMDAFSLLHIRG